MDLENKITDIFKAKDVEPKPRDTNSVLELKKIEQQLNLHLKNKQGLKFNKISIAYDKSYNEEKFSEIINEELKNKVANKKWKGLPMFMKWRLLQTFFENNEITDKTYIDNVKSKLMKNSLEVEYEQQKVLKII